MKLWQTALVEAGYEDPSGWLGRCANRQRAYGNEANKDCGFSVPLDLYIGKLEESNPSDFGFNRARERDLCTLVKPRKAGSVSLTMTFWEGQGGPGAPPGRRGHLTWHARSGFRNAAKPWACRISGPIVDW